MWSALEDSSGARGWYDDSIDGVVRRLQSLDDVRMKVIGVDRPPSEGDVSWRRCIVVDGKLIVI